MAERRLLVVAGDYADVPGQRHAYAQDPSARRRRAGGSNRAQSGGISERPARRADQRFDDCAEAVKEGRREALERAVSRDKRPVSLLSLGRWRAHAAPSVPDLLMTVSSFAPSPRSGDGAVSSNISVQ